MAQKEAVERVERKLPRTQSAAGGLNAEGGLLLTNCLSKKPAGGGCDTCVYRASLEDMLWWNILPRERAHYEHAVTAGLTEECTSAPVTLKLTRGHRQVPNESKIIIWLSPRRFAVSMRVSWRKQKRYLGILIDGIVCNLCLNFTRGKLATSQSRYATNAHLYTLSRFNYLWYFNRLKFSSFSTKVICNKRKTNTTQSSRTWDKF